MLSSPTRVVAVVVTFNRSVLLRLVLDALRDQTHAISEVLVVDNCSTDDTANVLNDYAVTVERLDSNRGSSGGFAHGVARAAERDCDWIWMMDDDAVPALDALERMLGESLVRRPETAAAGPIKVGEDGRLQANHAGHYRLATGVIAASDAQPGQAAREVDYLSFVGLMVRRRVAQAETVDADLFIGCDDIEYLQRIRRRGACVLVPASVIVHHNVFGGARERRWGRSVALGGAWRTYYTMRNPLLIARRYGTPAQRATAAASYVAKTLARTAAALVYHDHPVQRIIYTWRGLRDGLLGRSGPRVRP